MSEQIWMPKFLLLQAFASAVLIMSGTTHLSAQTPDEDLAKAKLHLQQLATELRELEECQIILLVTDQSEQRDQTLKLLSASYEQKSDALANAIEGLITKYATVQGSTAPRGHGESLASFRYRMWRFTLGAGQSRYRKDLTVAKCGAMVSSL